MQREITIENENNEIDVRVDESQRVVTTLKILGEARDEFACASNCVDIRIKRTGRQIDKNKTYSELGIYNGEIICLA